MNMSMMNLSKKIALILCLAATPYWSFGMEKEDSNQSPYRNGADMLNSLEGGLTLVNNGESNQLCTHAHLQDLFKKSLVNHNDKANEELFQLGMTGSPLAVGYLEYSVCIKASNDIFEKYKTNKLLFSSMLSEAIQTLVFTVKNAPCYVESTCDVMVDVLNTPEEWAEYYCSILPILEENNEFVLELFNDVCYKSIFAISWIKAYVSTLDNIDEYYQSLLINKIIDRYEKVYKPQRLATLSAADLIPLDISKTTTNHMQLKNHKLEECYSKLKVYEGVIELRNAEVNSKGEAKAKAKEELIIIRKSTSFKTYDKNQPKDQGYYLRLIEAKPAKLYEWGQVNRDTKDPAYAVDCYAEAGDTLKDHKKARQQLESVRKGKDYKLCYSALQKDTKIDFSKFKFEYYLAQRDYLLGLYYPKAQQKQGITKPEIDREVIHSKPIAQSLEKYLRSKEKVSIIERGVSKKEKNYKKQLEKLNEATDIKHKAKEELSKHLESIKKEEDELRELENLLSKLDMTPECDGEMVIISEEEKKSSSIQKIIEPKNNINWVAQRNPHSVKANESGEVTTLLNNAPINSMTMPINSMRRINSNQSTYEILPLNPEKKDENTLDQKETKRTLELTPRKRLSLLTRRNSTNGLIVPEKKFEEKKERKSLIRTQSVIDLKSRNNFEETSEEKDKKSKKSTNNSRNNANPTRALKAHKSEKKLERKNSQQNLSLMSDRESESESELSIGGEGSKNKYIQEGKRDIDLSKLKKLLNDRDLVVASDINITDSMVRRVLRDLADRKIITWSGQRPKSKDDKLTATHHQNPSICMTIHLHGDWWNNPAIKVHFLNFVRQCDLDIDAMISAIESRKSKK